MKPKKGSISRPILVYDRQISFCSVLCRRHAEFTVLQTSVSLNWGEGDGSALCMRSPLYSRGVLAGRAPTRAHIQNCARSLYSPSLLAARSLLSAAHTHARARGGGGEALGEGVPCAPSAAARTCAALLAVIALPHNGRLTIGRSEGVRSHTHTQMTTLESCV